MKEFLKGFAQGVERKTLGTPEPIRGKVKNRELTLEEKAAHQEAWGRKMEGDTGYEVRAHARGVEEEILARQKAADKEIAKLEKELMGDRETVEMNKLTSSSLAPFAEEIQNSEILDESRYTPDMKGLINIKQDIANAEGQLAIIRGEEEDEAVANFGNKVSRWFKNTFTSAGRQEAQQREYLKKTYSVQLATLSDLYNRMVNSLKGGISSANELDRQYEEAETVLSEDSKRRIAYEEAETIKLEEEPATVLSEDSKRRIAYEESETILSEDPHIETLLKEISDIKQEELPDVQLKDIGDYKDIISRILNDPSIKLQDIQNDLVKKREAQDQQYYSNNEHARQEALAQAIALVEYISSIEKYRFINSENPTIVPEDEQEGVADGFEIAPPGEDDDDQAEEGGRDTSDQREAA